MDASPGKNLDIRFGAGSLLAQWLNDTSSYKGIKTPGFVKAATIQKRKNYIWNIMLVILAVLVGTTIPLEDSRSQYCHVVYADVSPACHLRMQRYISVTNSPCLDRDIFWKKEIVQ